VHCRPGSAGRFPGGGGGGLAPRAPRTFARQRLFTDRGPVRSAPAHVGHRSGDRRAPGRPRLLLVVTPLCAVYLVIAGIGLHVITHGLGLANVTLGQALAVYFFSLAIGLIIPIPVDLGLTELGGVGALLVIGVNRNAAVGVMLLNRVLSIVAALLIALVAMAFLRDELRAVLRDRPRRAPRPRERAERA